MASSGIGTHKKSAKLHTFTRMVETMIECKTEKNGMKCTNIDWLM